MLPVAHPVAGHPHLDVPIALLAAGAFLVVLLVGLLLPGPAPVAVEPVSTNAAVASWDGDLRPAQWGVRAVVVAVLVVAVVAARVGADSELDNLAPALLVGAGWPLVFLGALLVPALWRWLDPWDTVGRVLAPGDRSGPGAGVLPALLPAYALLWYLAVHPRPLDPRSLGVAATVYTVVTVAGCIVRGRQRWLSTAEPVGIVLTRLAVARRRDPVGHEQHGVPLLLGVVAGGTLFAALRRTERWTDLADPAQPQLWGTVGLLVACAAGAALAQLQVWGTRAMQGRAQHPSAASVVVLGLAPAVAGIVVAVAMARNRLTTSLQLLPGLASDPFGEGWDLLGDPLSRLDPAPLGAAGLLAAQLVVLVLTHAWGAALVARRTSRQVRLPAVLLLGQLAAAGVAALALH